jgi:hypothetical protein
MKKAAFSYFVGSAGATLGRTYKMASAMHSIASPDAAQVASHSLSIVCGGDMMLKTKRSGVI